ncbi:hypothetical protein KSP39_PZI006392 [Platanthera zijinensis]|uniref:Dynein light chain n=1 Tax=Platanthera zijinensis TaxID=2320716 RepID=A0AAP0BRF6_9ASPA
MADETRGGGGGGGRLTTGGTLPHAGIRVFGDEEVSLAKRFVLKSADMKDEVQKEAINCALSAFDKHAVEKDIAEYMKKEFDKNHGPTWHCIVGRNFGNLSHCSFRLRLGGLLITGQAVRFMGS